MVRVDGGHMKYVMTWNIKYVMNMKDFVSSIHPVVKFKQQKYFGFSHGFSFQ